MQRLLFISPLGTLFRTNNMTIIRTAYETTAMPANRAMRETVLAVQRAMADGQLKLMPETKHVFMIEGGSSVADAIPAFAHTLEIKAEKATTFHHIAAGEPHPGQDPEELTYLVVDARQFGRWNKDQHTFRIINDVEYALMCHRAKLTGIWISQSPNLLRDVSPAPMTAFAMWISEAVAKRFALDPRQQLNLSILAAIFYASQFTDETELEGTDKMGLVTKIARNLRLSAQDVLLVADKVTIVNSLKEFCSLAEEVVGTVRMRDLNTGTLCAIMGGTWFSVNGRELACIALEHPPTWIAIMMQAITERTYKNTAVAKILERSSFRESGQSLVRSVLNLEHSVEF
jgi:hypothetical protein